MRRNVTKLPTGTLRVTLLSTPKVFWSGVNGGCGLIYSFICLKRRNYKGKYEEFDVHVTVHRDVHVTVHRDKFIIIKPTRFKNFSIFLNETLNVSDTSSVHHLELLTVHCNGIFHTDSFRAGSGWNCSSILILLEICLQTCTTYTISECTVNNSWWWTEELSETFRVSVKNTEKYLHLVVSIIRKYEGFFISVVKMSVCRNESVF
jgi:hypothetical protein